MSNTDMEDRRRALDAFAEAPARPAGDAVQILPMASTERVFGAQQVAVYRDEQRVLQKLSALGAAAGDDWFYRFPVKSKTGAKSFIEGPSIKLANDVARIYGNCEIDVRVIDLGASWLIYARFIDFESGFAMTRPFQQNKGGSRLGGDDDARRLDIAFQIGVSKAIRNVTVNALQTYADFAFQAARNSLVEKIGKDVQKWRNEMHVRLTDRGVELQRVEYVIGRAVADWTAPDIAKVIAMMKAIADGMATIDETFPPKDKQLQEKVDPATGEVTTEGAVAAEAGHPNGHAAGHQPAAGADSPAATENADGSDRKTAQSSEAGTTAGGTAASSPATSSQSSSPSPPSESAPKATEAAAAAETKGAADATKPAAAPKGPKVPSNEAEYVAHADAWREALTDAADGDKQWAAEKGMRNKANVGGDAREALQEKLAAKCAEIRDADKS